MAKAFTEEEKIKIKKKKKQIPEGCFINFYVSVRRLTVLATKATKE